MKTISLFLIATVIASLLFISCSDDDQPIFPTTDSDGSEDNGNGSNNLCQTCAAYVLEGASYAGQDVCKLINGNATVLGVDTGIVYEDYIQNLEQFTTCSQN